MVNFQLNPTCERDACFHRYRPGRKIHGVLPLARSRFDLSRRSTNAGAHPEGALISHPHHALVCFTMYVYKSPGRIAPRLRVHSPTPSIEIDLTFPAISVLVNAHRAYFEKVSRTFLRVNESVIRTLIFVCTEKRIPGRNATVSREEQFARQFKIYLRISCALLLFFTLYLKN